ncbi:type I secretion system permease/ATPase [Roseomonas sp. CCTCC AB2023176]|uniref:type I secretion system permease/ATPase n=1 Tax=Roseomonas sp. CCTCC AB2023176 TaxID=3342640 RepID=UPI0035E1D631
MPRLRPRGPDPLAKALSVARGAFVVAVVFSAVVNLLQLTVSLYMMQVFDRVLGARSLDTLLWLTVIAVGAVGLLALLDACRSQVMGRIGTWLEARMVPEAFHRALDATLVGRPYRMEALRDLQICRGWLGGPGALAMFDVPWVPIYLGVIFLLHPIMGWIALCGALALFGLTLLGEVLTAKPLKEAATASIAAQRKADAIARNAEVADTMGMSPDLLRRWREDVAESAPLQERAANTASVLAGITKFVRLALQLAVLGVGAWLVLRNELTSGASIAGSIIMGRALAPVEMLIGSWKGLVQARQARSRLREMMSLPRLRPDALPMAEPTGRFSAERLVWGLPGEPPIVKGVSFALEPGEVLSIIGPSAAGKSTLLRLLVGALPPANGASRLDGADLFRSDRATLGPHIGYLPQDVELFDGSVFQNISRLRPDATVEEAHQAAKLAGCHEAILRLRDGYATVIGEGGVRLSGGQKQMVGLARALYGKPKLVVLDEPDASLDGDAEARLIQGIGRLKALGTTVILVSHRPALVAASDKVLLMRDGAAEAFGPRAEVLAKLGPRPVPRPAAPAAAPGVSPATPGVLAVAGPKSVAAE